nr:hypothetical protein [Tanacetum cinerariifolium]
MASFDYRLNPLYPIKECLSCGALYTTDYCCSEGSLRDNIICDLNKTPDLSQRPPQNCPKILQNASEPSNDNTNVVNALQEPFVVQQDPENIFFHQCTCELYGKYAHYGYNCSPKVPIIPDLKPCNNQTIDELPQTVPSFYPTCYSEDRNSFTYDSKSNLVDDSPNVFNPPPQPQTYSYEFCGNDAYYGHDCPLQVPFAYDPEPCYDQDFNFPQNFQMFQQQYLCCTRCGGPHETCLLYINTPSWDCLTVCYNDDDDEDCTFEITLKEPDNSLSMGDEHLDTISAMESDEFIKSSVENLVPNPSESEALSGRNLSNPLFDEEIISIKIDPHYFSAESDLIESLLNHDSSIISSSSKIDSLFDEFTGKLILLKSIPSGINETDCDPEEETRLIKRLLYDNSSPRPPKEFVSENYDAAIESFSPFPIPVEDSDSFMEEIDLSFTPDEPMPPSIEEDDYDSKRDILILE